MPAHWDLFALKRIVQVCKSGESITAESIDQDGDFRYLVEMGYAGIHQLLLHEGHFVLIGRQGALCGNINYAHGNFWASEHAVVASPIKQVETVWLGEMLRAMNLNQYSVSAAQPGLSVDLVGKLKTVLPPLEEQSSIARFLGLEIAKIDELVSEQQRLIDLLKEKRQAVISHAVTKGVKLNVSMKPSAIEWLGEVPEHWELMTTKRLFF